MTEELKKPGVNLAAMLEGLKTPPEQPTIKTATLVRPQTFEGRRAGETPEFTKRRQKNRIRNKLAKASRKRR